MRTHTSYFYLVSLAITLLLAAPPSTAKHVVVDAMPGSGHSAGIALFTGEDDLRYSTYLGGSGSDEATAVAVGPDGDIYIAGNTTSLDFPTTPSAYQRSHHGNEDVFVARLDPATSTPVYITLLGGRATDQAFGLAVDGAGAAYVTGWTGPGNFPRTPGVFDNTGAGLWEGFVSKLSPDGSRLEYSTFLGGQETDWPRAIRVDANGAAIIVGDTRSPDFPVTPDALDMTCGTDGLCNAVNMIEAADTFVVRINPTATALEYGTFLGGSGNDYGFAINVGENGRIFVSGRSWSDDFPVTSGAFDTENSASGDGYIAALEGDGSALHFATFLNAAIINALNADGAGSVYVTGSTASVSFPATPGAYDTSYAGGLCGTVTNRYYCRDAFIAKLAADGSALDYATFLGGMRDDIAYGIALAADGTAYVTGSARSSDFPTTQDAYDPSFNGHTSFLCEDGDMCPDVYIAGITPDGTALNYSTFMGTKSREWGAAIVPGLDGRLVGIGVASAGFPTTPDAFDQTHNGGTDAFALILTPQSSNWLYLPLHIRLQSSAPPLFHSSPRFQVFILNPIRTCLVGNDFASGNVCRGPKCGDCDCEWADFDPPAPLTGVPPDQVNDSQYAEFEHKVCLDIRLTEQEIKDIIADLQRVREQVFKWSGGALDLQMEYTVLPHDYAGFVAPDFVVGPFEIDDELLQPYITTATDFVNVVTGVYDWAQGLNLSHWCGSAYGEMNIHGANYAYIQYHDGCNSISIAGEQVYEPLMHEWMHSLDWALYNVSHVPDIYQFAWPDWVNWQPASWPACGSGHPDPKAWFPSVDLCEWDPDWIDCNNNTSAGTCLHASEEDGISWYEHVISAHYPRSSQFIGNHCRDGIQDFTETGIDQGWPCPETRSERGASRSQYGK